MDKGERVPSSRFREVFDALPAVRRWCERMLGKERANELLLPLEAEFTDN
jgi:hypothetical protein